jgi:hypothetical protein
VCGCSVLAGCGNSRTPPPDLSVAAPPAGFTRQAFSSAGLTLRSPNAWALQAGSPPLVLAVRSGLAAVVVWRYPRTQALPHTAGQLHLALRRLVATVRARDATFRLGSAAVVPVAHRGSIQLRGLETIDGQLREVRSTHVYAHGAELVIDAFAPPAQFRKVDRQVFHPLLRSVGVTAPGP